MPSKMPTELRHLIEIRDAVQSRLPFVEPEYEQIALDQLRLAEEAIDVEFRRIRAER